MDAVAVKLGRRAARLRALNTALSIQVKHLLAAACWADASDSGAGQALLAAIGEVGRGAQAREGELVLVLAQADRLKGNKGGLAPWLSIHLDVTEGAACGIARSAREIGHVPELADALASGRVGTGTIRALTRAARAVRGTGLDLAEALTAILDLVAAQGIGAAIKKVRILEETLDPGRAGRLPARRRSRSFLRVLPCEGGMYRIEALLDPEWGHRVQGGAGSNRLLLAAGPAARPRAAGG